MNRFLDNSAVKKPEELRQSFVTFSILSNDLGHKREISAILQKYNESFSHRCYTFIKNYLLGFNDIEPLFQSQLIKNLVGQLYPIFKSNGWRSSDNSSNVLSIFEILEGNCSSQQRYEILIDYNLGECLVYLFLRLGKSKTKSRVRAILISYLYLSPDDIDRVINSQFHENQTDCLIKGGLIPGQFEFKESLLSTNILIMIYSQCSDVYKKNFIDRDILEYAVIFLQIYKDKDTAQETCCRLVQFIRIMSIGCENELFNKTYCLNLFAVLFEILNHSDSNDLKRSSMKLLASIIKWNNSQESSKLQFSSNVVFSSISSLLLSSTSHFSDTLIAEFLLLCLESFQSLPETVFNKSELRVIENKFDNIIYINSEPMVYEMPEEESSSLPDTNPIIVNRKCLLSYLRLLLNENFEKLISHSENFIDFVIFTQFFEYIDILYENCYEDPHIKSCILRLLQRFSKEEAIKKQLASGVTLGKLISILIVELSNYEKYTASKDSLNDILEDLIKILVSCPREDVFDFFDDVLENDIYCTALLSFIASNYSENKREFKLMSIELLVALSEVKDFVPILCLHRFPEIFEQLTTQLISTIHMNLNHQLVDEDVVLAVQLTFKLLICLASSEDGFRALLATKMLDPTIENMIKYCADGYTSEAHPILRPTPVYKPACLKFVNKLLRKSNTTEHTVDKIRLATNYNILESLVLPVLNLEFRSAYSNPKDMTLVVIRTVIKLLISLLDIGAYGPRDLASSGVLDELANIQYDQALLIQSLLDCNLSLIVTCLDFQMSMNELLEFLVKVRYYDFVVSTFNSNMLKDPQTSDQFFSEFFNTVLQVNRSVLWINKNFTLVKFSIIPRLIDIALSVACSKSEKAVEKLEYICSFLSQLMVDFEFFPDKATITLQLLEVFDQLQSYSGQSSASLNNILFNCLCNTMLEDPKMVFVVDDMVLNLALTEGISDPNLQLLIWKCLFVFSLSKTKFYKFHTVELLRNILKNHTKTGIQELVVQSKGYLQYYSVRTLLELCINEEEQELLDQSENGLTRKQVKNQMKFSTNNEVLMILNQEFNLNTRFVDQLLAQFVEPNSKISELIYYQLLTLRDVLMTYEIECSKFADQVVVSA